MSDSPPNSPATGALVNFRNPFEERDLDEVWKELLAESLQLISQEEAI